MSERLQLRAKQLVQARLEVNAVGRLGRREPRAIAGRLQIGAMVDQVEQHLHVALRLLRAAHEAEGGERAAVLHDESRQQGVERPFAGSDEIRAAWIQRKERGAVVQYETVARHRDAGAEGVVDTVNE